MHPALGHRPQAVSRWSRIVRTQDAAQLEPHFGQRSTILQERLLPREFLEVKYLVADRYAGMRNLLLSAKHADRQILDREIGIRGVRGPDPALEVRVVSFVEAAQVSLIIITG